MKKVSKTRKYVKPNVKKKLVKLSRFVNKTSFLVDDAMFLALCRSTYCCLLPQVKISLANKSTVTVEKLRVGDIVISYDTVIQEFSESEVVHILSKYRDSYYILNNSLKLTDDHPLWVNNMGWKRADEIVEGDRLYSQDNKLITVSSKILIKKKSLVYNIQLSGENKSYFANSILTQTYSYIHGVYALGSNIAQKNRDSLHNFQATLHIQG